MILCRKCNSWLPSDKLAKYKDVIEDHDRRNKKLTDVLHSFNEPQKPNGIDQSFLVGGKVQPRLKMKIADSEAPLGWSPFPMHNYCQPGGGGLKRVLPRNDMRFKDDNMMRSPSFTGLIDPQSGRVGYPNFNKFDDICNYFIPPDNTQQEKNNVRLSYI